ncbi:MAG: two-component system response regulator HydG [Verrucomicrobiales bacterium]|jgi:two-component system response regulator HydG
MDSGNCSGPPKCDGFKSDDVLVVDDDPDMVKGLARILKSRSYKVRQALSGRDALEQVRQHRPGVVLMDIKMPDMNGIDAFREMKLICPDVLVIFMTGFSEYDQAGVAGAAAVLPKPIDHQRLFETLEKAGFAN